MAAGQPGTQGNIHAINRLQWAVVEPPDPSTECRLPAHLRPSIQCIDPGGAPAFSGRGQGEPIAGNDLFGQ
jgi:hypothetical protein